MSFSSSSDDDVFDFGTIRKPSITSLESPDDASVSDDVEYTNCRMEELPCFHEATSRGKSEVLLENSPEGGFLIRSSSASVNYCLSVRTANAVRHFRVDFDGERYSFGQAVFWSPLQIWEHLQQKPVIECDEDVKVQLLHPYCDEVKRSCSFNNSARYSTIGRHYVPEGEIAIKSTAKDKQKRFSTSSNGSITSSIITSLEGELFKKKEGKNWKRRWCVLRGNHLTYRKSEGAGKLLNKLDLTEALEVQEVHDELVRKNCFRVRFPNVYFIFSSELAADKYVWFERIQRQIEGRNKAHSLDNAPA